MKAEDTVIRVSEVVAAIESKEGALSKACAVLDYIAPKIVGILEDGRKAGIKEVVGWIDFNVILDDDSDREAWRAKVKEWGIKEEL